MHFARSFNAWEAKASFLIYVKMIYNVGEHKYYEKMIRFIWGEN